MFVFYTILIKRQLTLLTACMYRQRSVNTLIPSSIKSEKLEPKNGKDLNVFVNINPLVSFYCFHSVTDVIPLIWRVNIFFTHNRYIAGFSLQHGHHSNPATPNLQHTTNWEQDDRCGNSTTQSQAPDDGYINAETCWAHKKCNEIASDIKLVFYSSTDSISFIMVYTERLHGKDDNCMKYEHPSLYSYSIDTNLHK